VGFLRCTGLGCLLITAVLVAGVYASFSAIVIAVVMLAVLIG